MAVEAEQLIPTDRILSGGTFPVSVTVHQNLVYVLYKAEGTVTGFTAVAVDSHAVIDSAVSADGRFLYVLTGGFSVTSNARVTCNPMTISAFRIESNGNLTSIPGPGGLAPGTQGIVAV